MSTYTPIASITLASAASSVTFSGIPQTYTDLVVVVDAKSAGDNVLARVNGDSGSNYSITRLSGNGSTASSARGSNTTYLNFDGGAYLTTGSSVWTIQFMNYSNTTTNKTILSRGNNAATGVDASVNLWRNTSAITSITFIATSNTYQSGSTFNLYGIANASLDNVAKATGGDSVYTDGTYWYHIFRSSGTFTPTQALTADYLVVAGGGSGGEGGGGAGGLRSTVGATGGGGSLESPLSLQLNASYTVTVGAGGAAPTAWDNPGSQGSNSSISGTGITTVTSTGGGYGTTVSGQGNGGSGGGEGRDQKGSNGTGTANQGYAGGICTSASWGGAGGGGGAGAVGGNGSGGSSGSETGGNGGNGVQTNITGTNTYYAGGGGGGVEGSGGRGSGGLGGGGQGNLNNDSSHTAGTANTGGGGGGANGPKNGRAGGSGIIVIRYSAA